MNCPRGCGQMRVVRRSRDFVIYHCPVCSITLTSAEKRKVPDGSEKVDCRSH